MIRCLKKFSSDSKYLCKCSPQKKIDKYLEYIEIVFQKNQKKINECIFNYRS